MKKEKIVFEEISNKFVITKKEITTNDDIVNYIKKLIARTDHADLALVAMRCLYYDNTDIQVKNTTHFVTLFINQIEFVPGAKASAYFIITIKLNEKIQTFNVSIDTSYKEINMRIRKFIKDHLWTDTDRIN